MTAEKKKTRSTRTRKAGKGTSAERQRAARPQMLERLADQKRLLEELKAGLVREERRREQMEVSIQLSEERFRIALETSGISFFELDKDLRYTWVYNPVPGFVVEALMGSSKVDLDSTSGENMQEMIRRVAETEQGTRQQVRVTFGGESRSYDLIAEPMKDLAGQVIGLACAVVDITRHMDSEQQLRQLNDSLRWQAAELQVLNRDLEGFGYSVSHDLRTPLAAILTLVHVVEERHEKQLPADALKILRLVEQHAQQMNQLVDSLLDLSQFTRQPIRKQTVNTGELVRELINSGELDGARAGREVEFSIGELPACEADPVLIRQVWYNLLSNAVKFSRGQARPVVEVGYTLEEGGAYFVRDNGVGFDRDQALTLFAPFQRFHSQEEYEGRGVGLAIVERIVRRHGGRVWAEAEEERGAAFYFTLPADAILSK